MWWWFEVSNSKQLLSCKSHLLCLSVTPVGTWALCVTCLSMGSHQFKTLSDKTHAHANKRTYKDTRQIHKLKNTKDTDTGITPHTFSQKYTMSNPYTHKDNTHKNIFSLVFFLLVGEASVLRHLSSQVHTSWNAFWSVLNFVKCKKMFKSISFKIPYMYFHEPSNTCQGNGEGMGWDGLGGRSRSCFKLSVSCCSSFSWFSFLWRENTHM